MLHMVHLIESLHGSDDLSTGHLLIESVDKAIGTCPVVKRNCKRVELRIKSVCLSAEGETSWHTELKRKW